MLSRMLAVLLGGSLYWWLVTVTAGVAEPWDADWYWSALYPASVALAAVAGMWVQKRAWAAGLLLTFGQLPIMWLNAGVGPSWMVGVLALLLLSLPPLIAAHLASRLARAAPL